MNAVIRIKITIRFYFVKCRKMISQIISRERTQRTQKATLLSLFSFAPFAFFCGKLQISLARIWGTAAAHRAALRTGCGCDREVAGRRLNADELDFDSQLPIVSGPRPHGRSYAKLGVRFFLTRMTNLVGNFGLSFQRESAYCPRPDNIRHSVVSRGDDPRESPSRRCTDAIVTRSLRA